MSPTVPDLVTTLQNAATQLNVAASLTRAPTAAQKTAFLNAATALQNTVVPDLNRRKSCVHS